MPDFPIEDFSPNVYYDDTFWGKGDSGFFIGTHKDGYIFLIGQDSDNIVTNFFGSIINLEVNKSMLIITYRDLNVNSTKQYSLSFSNCEKVLESLKDFHESISDGNLYKEEVEEEEEFSPIPPKKDGAGIRK